MFIAKDLNYVASYRKRRTRAFRHQRRFKRAVRRNAVKGVMLLTRPGIVFTKEYEQSDEFCDSFNVCDFIMHDLAHQIGGIKPLVQIMLEYRSDQGHLFN